MRSKVPVWQLTVRMIGLFALVMTAFAHKPVGFLHDQDPGFAAYVLPDGTLPILCLTGENNGGNGPEAYQGACEFCHIAGSIVLPAPDQFGCRVVTGRSRPQLPRPEDPLLAWKTSLLPPTRGPPPIAA